MATYALLGSLAFAACSKKSDTVTQALPSPATATARLAVTADFATDASKDRAGMERPADGRKVIRTGQIHLVIGSYDDARAKLEALLKACGGYVDSTEVSHHQGAVSNATLVLRIPADAFTSILPKLRELGEISSESTNAADITAEYVDIAARLASAKILEKRLLELAAGRTSNVEALLAVERELARVRGEIESYEGRMRAWNDQIALSTLTLGMSTKAPAIAAAPEPGLGARISNGFNSSIAALQDFGSWLAVTGTSLVPWLVLMVPGFFVGRRAWRRYGRRMLPSAIARTAPPVEPPAPTV